jgi:hypothetical protein
MSSEPTPHSSSNHDHGLPPVHPPTGGMILRQFIVPAIIVAVLVMLFLAGPTLYAWVNRLVGRSSEARSAEQFLRDIDNPNQEVRWRAASDLAQVLLRKDSLASNVGFTLQLANRLQTAIDQSADAEKSFAAHEGGLSAGDKARDLARLEPDRNLITYLGASLGNCIVPIGAPLLEQMSLQQTSMEREALAERRRRALFALATLGDNLKRFDKLSDEDKDAIEEQLESAVTTSSHSRWTRATLDYLRQRRKGKNDTMGVADALEKCSRDEDPFLRELAALASNFWTGTAVEEARIEKFLVRLSHDDGAGEDGLAERIERNAGSTQSRALTTKKGFKVQANATIALARRGSPRVRLDLLQEMLDPERLREVFVLRISQRGKGSEDQPDESMVAVTLTDSLKALVPLHRKRPEMKLDRFMPLVEKLTENDNVAIRTEAEQTQMALRKE